VHRLGNLALLTREKNRQAYNYDFATKKRSYFAMKDGISPFVLTTQVLQEHEWTPEVVERRQNELIAHLRKLWRL
ncbi:MAG TPA: HNH endonuclease family protein, partial [Ktedonobacterales bacterium]|nr:HNH endonuclease family protein [Ktedonobacterales bacterium]